MRVVVSGYFGHGNTGDEALLAGMLVTMRAVEPGLGAVVISGNPPETRRTHGVEAVPRMRPTAICRALRAADGLISGGGGLLQDRTSARPVAYYAGVMGLARLARRPYVVHAQGLGPIEWRLNRTLTAMALRGAAHVSLRDSESIGLARELGVRRAIDLVPDPAIALRPERGEPGHIVVAVRAWGGRLDHLLPIREAIQVLSAEHRILALPMHEPMDREPSEIVVDGIPGAAVVPPETSLHERLALIGSASLVIGMRLHALVLAAAAGVPGVAISYDPKVDAFASRVGMPIPADLASVIEPARIVEAARRELDAVLTGRQRIVDEMRDQVRASADASLAAIRGSSTRG
jgi:polysaccharide pyruvyl transferase CsaB